jgi:hypothetical protein
MTNFGELIKKEMRGNLQIVCNKDDVLQAIDFVAELMDLFRKECEENHPHASVSLREIKKSYEQLRNLEKWIEEELEK